MYMYLVMNPDNPMENCIRRIWELIKCFSNSSKRIKTTYGKQFLIYGVVRRLEQIKFILKRINDIYPEHKTDPLTQDQRVELILLLNSFYLNLLGSIDNVSWSIAYEIGFISDTYSEGFEPNEKQKVDILKRDRNYLGSKLEGIFFTDYLDFHKRYKEKISSIKKKRHVSAHRIPFYISNEISENKKVEYNQLQMRLNKSTIEMIEFPPEMLYTETDSHEDKYKKATQQLDYQKDKEAIKNKLCEDMNKLERPSLYIIGEFNEKTEYQFLVHPTIADECNLLCDFLEDSLIFFKQQT